MNKENKTCCIQFRCIVSEKESIRKLAKEVSLNMSEFLLRQNNKHIVHHIPLLKMMEYLTYNDLKVENNINQIAKNINTRNSVITDEKINELIYWLIELGKKRDNITYELNGIRKILAR